MSASSEFQTELVKLADGSRVIRVTDAATATVLERRVRADKPVRRQTAALAAALRVMLAGELKESTLA